VEIVVTTQPDRDGMLRAMRHARRKPVRQVRLLCAGYVVAGVALLLMPDLITTLLGIALLGIAAMTEVMQWWLYWRARRRNLLGLTVPRTVTLTDRGVELTTRLTSARLDWRVFKGVDLMPGLLIIFITHLKILVVPTDGLTGEEIAEITAVLSRVPWGRETMAAA